MTSRRTTSIKHADAILTADLHIRPDTPVGRKDDYTSAMFRKIDFIINLSKEHQCPILVAGDLGNQPGDKENRVNDNAWPSWLLRSIIRRFSETKVIVIPGQHDLPNHQLDLWERSGIGVLQAAGAIELLGTNEISNEPIHFQNFSITPFPYNQPIKDVGWVHIYPLPVSPLIAMTHQMIVENKDLFPDQNAVRGHQLLKEFPEYALIISGDNHNSFVAEYEGQLLVNPGSMMRNTIDQINHKPRVYLWYADENKVVPVFLPIEEDVFDLKYIENVEAKEIRDARFDTLITRVKQDIEIQLSFEDNTEKYFKEFRTEKSVIDKTWAHIK